MRIDMMTKINYPCSISANKENKKPMEVLWGAWVKRIIYSEQSKTYPFEGIYDTIDKAKKTDYPFYTDLMVVLACKGSPAEYERIYDVLLDLIDTDAINNLITQDEK